MAKSEIRATLTLDCSQFSDGISQMESGISRLSSKAKGSFSDVASQVKGLGNTLIDSGKKLTVAGLAMQEVFSPLAGILTESISTAVDFEDAFSGVKKTIDTSGMSADEAAAFFNKLQEGILELAKTSPVSITELAKIQETLGQLGIHGEEDINGLTDCLSKFAIASDMTADQSAKSLGSYFNVVYGGIDNVEDLTDSSNRLLSTVVKLGNDTAATESQIWSFMNGISGISAYVKVSDAQMAGWSATMQNVDLNLEAGSTSMKNWVSRMSAAVSAGGESLQAYADIAGMTVDEFVTLFEQDANGAMMAVMQGMNGVIESGGDVNSTLKAIGMESIRDRDFMIRLAKAYPLLADNMDIATSEYENGTAMQEEYAKKCETVASKLQMLRNKFDVLKVTIGNVLLPVLGKLIDFAGKIVDGIGKIPAPILAFVGIIGVLGVAIGKVIQTVGMFGLALDGLTTIAPLMTKLFGALSGVFKAVGAAIMGISAPMLVVIAVVAALVAAFTLAWKYCDGFKEGIMKAFDGIKKMVSAVSKLLKGDFKGAWEAVKEGAQMAWEGIKDAGKAIVESVKNIASKAVEAFKEFKEKLPDIVAKAKEAVVTKMGEWKEAFKTKAKEAGSNIVEGFENLKEKLPEKLNNAKNAVINGLQTWIKEYPQKVKEAKEKMVKAFEATKEFGSKIMDIREDMLAKLDEWKKAFADKVQEVKEKMIEKFETWKEELPQKIQEVTERLVEKINTWTEELPSKIDNVKEKMLEKIDAWKESLPVKIDELKEKMIEKLNTWIEELPQKITELMQSFCDMITGKSPEVSGSMEQVGKDMGTKLEETKESLPRIMLECMGEIALAIIKAIPQLLWAMAQAFAQLVASFFTDLLPALVKAMGECMVAVGKAIVDAIPQVVSKIKELWDKCKTATLEGWNNIKREVSNKCVDIKNDIVNKWGDIKTRIGQKIGEIKSDVSTRWNGIKSAISSKASGIIEACTKPFTDAWNFIRNIPSKIASAFSSIRISIPKPKLPHISVGSKSVFGGKVSIPTFSIDWYAKGGFFDKASMIGVGEAGKEAVLPLENKKNMKPYAQAVASLMDDMNANGNGGNCTINITQYNTINNDLDIKKVSQELAKQSERELRRKGIAPQYSR